MLYHVYLPTGKAYWMWKLVELLLFSVQSATYLWIGGPAVSQVMFISNTIKSRVLLVSGTGTDVILFALYGNLKFSRTLTCIWSKVFFHDATRIAWQNDLKRFHRLQYFPNNPLIVWIWYHLVTLWPTCLVGPWFIGELVDGHLGVSAVWGVYVNGAFVPGTLTYIYGLIQVR